MDQGAVKVIVHEVLGGVFDVFGAIAEARFVFAPSDQNDTDQDSLSALIEILPVCVRAKVSGGGELALLWSTADVARIQAITDNQEPKETLDEEDLARFE